MNDLEKYELVNRCETPSELYESIIKLTDPDTGFIHGRTRYFEGKKMAENMLLVLHGAQPNLLTREYGIRQQALYLKYYNN
jgi:hypothetical protein